jgi:hypothetical protein
MVVQAQAALQAQVQLTHGAQLLVLQLKLDMAVPVVVQVQDLMVQPARQTREWAHEVQTTTLGTAASQAAAV